MKRIVLASGSPRRKELMSLITEDFEVKTSSVDERLIEEQHKAEGPRIVALNEARAKAEAVWDTLSIDERQSKIVVAADTSVVLGDIIMGKPKDREDAVNMLTSLSGRSHSVITGVWVISDSKSEGFYEESFVHFAKYDDYQKDLIERYVDSGDPYDKAGAYGIQNGGALLVDKVDGDYFNVVGLPVKRLARLLNSFT